MTPAKTIDIKGLDHAEKEARLFPGIEALAPGETARIVVEFNPVPLVYLLTTGGQYDIAFEKEGPDEWVMLATRKAGPAEKLRSPVFHGEAKGDLCGIHLESIRDSLVAGRVEVVAPHPVNTLMEEHKLILGYLGRLGETADRLRGMSSFAEIDAEIDGLKDISHHLVEAEKHHQREEEALFPMVERHGITEPPRIMVLDHVEFRKRKRELERIAHNPEAFQFTEFRSRVLDASDFLTRELKNHIFKEDNILYQIALQALSADEWVSVKSKCDAIGYCCFTPADAR